MSKRINRVPAAASAAGSSTSQPDCPLAGSPTGQLAHQMVATADHSTTG